VQELDIFTKPVERVPLNLANPETPEMEELKFIIIHSENAEQVFAKMKEQNKDPVLFGLSDDDYETLAKNFAQIRAYMIKQQQIIDQYKEYYESDSTPESAPSK
jgi:polyphosphate kinase